jgi:nitrogenase-associated protein
MSVVVFYEKPGCSGNAKQKKILEMAGHTVLARDLIAARWRRGELLSFFTGLPVADWFNCNSPAVKSGEVVPEALDESAALALLEAYPLLIRRPLLEVDGIRRAGFDVALIDAWIGLPGIDVEGDAEACAHDEGHRCEGHDHEH